jgi:hypothetical protein
MLFAWSDHEAGGHDHMSVVCAANPGDERSLPQNQR